MDTRSYEERVGRGTRDKTKVQPAVPVLSMCTA